METKSEISNINILPSCLETKMVESEKVNNLFIAINRTLPQLKKNLWVCQNVPCKIVSITKTTIHMLPFNSKTIASFKLNEIIKKEYKYLESDETYVYIPNYPEGRVPISEFNVKQISLKNLKKHFKDTSMLKAIEKVEQDSFHSKGNQFCATINEYNNYKTNPTTSKLERIGDPIFNRSVRHSPPISKTFTRKNFEDSFSYPAPIGIRYEDFAWPSEQNEICIELLSQIFSCKNAPKCPEELKTELGIIIKENSHMCLWCGELIDISELNQEYCSKEHSINFCHRVPAYGTKKGNVYIGHCSCNREQGGFSEEEHIEQVIRLVKHNPSYREKILQSLLNL